MLLLRGQILKIMKKKEDKKYQKILFLGQDNFPRYINIKPEKVNEVKGLENKEIDMKVIIKNFGDKLIYFYAGLDVQNKMGIAEGF